MKWIKTSRFICGKINLPSWSLFIGIFIAARLGALEIGDMAPDFNLPGIRGTVSLSQTHGKVVFLDFWVSWCDLCRKSFPWMNALQMKYQDRGLQIIAVNLDENPEDVQNFLARHPVRFTIAFNPAGSLPRQYGVQGMPSAFLIGRDGRLLYQHQGFNETVRNQMEQQIASILHKIPDK